MRILVAPLDWGLGHATRCIPIIRALEEEGVEPVLGCAGRAGELLQDECPGLPYVDLPSYNIRYSSASMAISMAKQLPGFLTTMRKEHLILRELIRRHDIAGVISDNRYGFYSKRVPSVLISHQLHPRVPIGLLARPVQAVLGYWINRFDACWVPDYAEAQGLAGELAHPARHLQTRYLGPVSRFGAYPKRAARYDILCVLSGPEPQRSRLETLLLPQLKASNLRVMLVQGLTGSDDLVLEGNVEIRSHMLGDELNRCLAASRLLLCRPGYSTIMDLNQAGGKAVFIPTPGQTEQEYLAEKFFRSGTCYMHAQDGFDLEEALSQQHAFSGFAGRQDKGQESMRLVVRAWLKEVSRKASN